MFMQLLSVYLRRQRPWLLLISILLMYTPTQPLRAAEFNPTCDLASITATFALATSNGLSDVINLPPNCIYTFSAPNNAFDGANALPSILNDANGLDLLINGNGATLRRDPEKPDFRLLHISPGADVELNDLRIEQGRAPVGGGLYIAPPAGTATIRGSMFSENTATGNGGDYGGGAIAVQSGVLTVADSTFIANVTLATQPKGDGGAIRNLDSDLIITNSFFSQNRATRVGGAVAIGGANPATGYTSLIQSSRFSNNTSLVGGALYVCLLEPTRTLLIDQSSIINNNATSQGGGVFSTCSGNLDLSRSTFSGNVAGAQGGGLVVDQTTAIIRNSTLALNFTTAANGQGGAIFINAGRIATRNATIASNSASVGGGIAGGNANSTLTNTILSNTATNAAKTNFNCFGSLMTNSGNNIEFAQSSPDQCMVGGLNADPLLKTLSDNNGGPTATMELISGSPAIDGGYAPLCPGLDQRDYTRGTPCDIGAYEFLGTPFRPTKFLYLPVIRR